MYENLSGNWLGEITGMTWILIGLSLKVALVCRSIYSIHSWPCTKTIPIETRLNKSSTSRKVNPHRKKNKVSWKHFQTKNGLWSLSQTSISHSKFTKRLNFYMLWIKSRTIIETELKQTDRNIFRSIQHIAVKKISFLYT